MLHASGLDELVCKRLGFETREPDLTGWSALCRRINNPQKKVNIAIVGKYVELHDAYLSVVEALNHAGYANNAAVTLDWVDSESLTPETVDERMAKADGVLVPGGFGKRGIEGMVLAADWARRTGVPYFGICLGMQIAVIDAARSLANLPAANSREFDPEGSACVIDLMPDQQGNLPKGGTMRLGAYPCAVQPGTLLHRIYGQSMVSERHRHRYEVSNDFRAALSGAGVVFSGLSPDGRLVEAMELPGHPFFVGVQYHPEFKSRPDRPQPIFRAFVAAALDHQE